MNKRSYQSTLRGPNARGKLDEMPLNETTAEQDERMQKARDIAAEVLARLRAEQADPFADPQPPSEAEKQAEEVETYRDWGWNDDIAVQNELRDIGNETNSAYMQADLELDRLLAPEIVRGELASSHKRISLLPPGRKVIVTARFAEHWTDNPEHYKERFNAQDVEIKP